MASRRPLTKKQRMAIEERAKRFRIRDTDRTAGMVELAILNPRGFEADTVIIRRRDGVPWGVAIAREPIHRLSPLDNITARFVGACALNDQLPLF
jgi:hypothetical protein